LLRGHRVTVNGGKGDDAERNNANICVYKYSREKCIGKYGYGILGRQITTLREMRQPDFAIPGYKIVLSEGGV
jgi:hypothetical protein